MDKLEEIFGKKERTEFDEIRCNYKECSAGMGVAGMLVCFLGGDYRDPKCSKFVDEEKMLKEWENAITL
jgi:hypothetical protein